MKMKERKTKTKTKENSHLIAGILLPNFKQLNQKLKQKRNNMTTQAELARQAVLAMMEDADAQALLDEVAMTETGVSTEFKTIPETTVKLALQSTEKAPAISLNFGLSKKYLEDPINWSNDQYPDSFFWSGINLNFELLSREPLEALSRDNAFYRVSSMVNKNDNEDVRRIGRSIDFDIYPIKNRDGVVTKKGFGLDLQGRRLLKFLGSIVAPFGMATLQADGVSYVFTKDFFEELNNGVAVLKQALLEKVMEGEDISEEVKLNHPSLVTYFIAQKQLQNLNDMLMQREVEFRTFGGVIGREPIPEDKNRQRNYVKDVAHSATEEGGKLLERAVA